MGANPTIGSVTVRMQDRSYFGRVLYTATKLTDGRWSVSGSYPATGVDNVDFHIHNTEEPLDTVAKLRAWVADNFELIEPSVSAARRRRYALRREMFDKEE